MLNIAAVKAARPRAAAYKLYDQAGLHLYVAPNGRRSFRLRYRIAGREQLLTFGTWPEISLDVARSRAEAAHAAMARGEDPRAAAANRASAATTFEQIARRWFAHMQPRWTDIHADDVLASLERDVFPAIGAMPIGAITAPVVLNALRVIEERGCLETARRVRQRISGIFAFAISEGLTESDPAAIVGRALTPPGPQRPQPALIEMEDARGLLAAAELVDGAPIAKLASRFLALTAVRLAAVRGAHWDEFEDLDGAAPVWRVPAARMKLAAAKKREARNAHLVPLSRQAVEVLRIARAAGQGGLVFPGRRVSSPLGVGAIGALYARTPFAGRHVPHGWRATFSTILNEAFPGDRVAIDRALAHAPKDKVEAAYNRSEQLAMRRRLFQDWADMLIPPDP
jgi:integrase